MPVVGDDRRQGHPARDVGVALCQQLLGLRSGYMHCHVSGPRVKVLCAGEYKLRRPCAHRAPDSDWPLCPTADRQGPRAMTSNGSQARAVDTSTLQDARQAAPDDALHAPLRVRRRRGADHQPAARAAGCTTRHGKRYFDGLAGLFCTQIGYSYGDELGEAAAQQMAELPFYTNWSYAHPRAIELAAKVAELAPGDLNRVFFVSGGSEANEAIIKLVKQYHQLHGNHRRYKMIARRIAYHGTTLGALSLTGIYPLKTPFEPLMPGVRHVSNTNRYRRPEGETEQEFTRVPAGGAARGDRAGGPGLGCGRLHGAGAELRRHVHAARGLLPGRARDLRRVRRAAGRRRGDLRIRPAGRRGSARRSTTSAPTSSRSPRASARRTCRWAACS